MPPQPVRSRVLYLGTGSPLAPSTGMDMVSRAHLDELRADPALDVTGLVVASSNADGHAAVAPAGMTLLAGDSLAGVSRAGIAWAKAAYAATGCGTLIAFSFRSAAARRLIRAALASGDYDVVIVDHFLTMANIRLRDLRASRAGLVFIAHDITSEQLLDIGRMKQRWRSRLPFALEAWKIARSERAIFRLARCVVFLSDHDAMHYGAAFGTPLSLLPLLAEAGEVAAAAGQVRQVVFMGSVSYMPNRLAIEWMVGAFAAALHQADPTIRIVLVGQGTQRFDNGRQISGRGFVSDQAMAELIDISAAVICPIVYGSGIKIKVLDALARSCPVFATAQALRGFGDFGIDPVIEIGDPDGSARRVAALAGDAAALARERARLAAAWAAFRAGRQGRLAQAAIAAADPTGADARR